MEMTPEEMEAADQQIARASALWPQAVAFLKGHFDRLDRVNLRAAIAADPEGWVTPHHLYWGMAVRNLLRDHGFGEKPFGVQNLDNIYVPLVEEAVQQDEQPVKWPMDVTKVTRVEVVGDGGRLFTMWGNLPGVELHLQDDQRTLKVYVVGDTVTRRRPNGE